MPCFFLSLCFFVLQMVFCCVQYKQCCHPRWFPHQIARQQSSTGAAFCEMPRCLAMPRPLKASSKPSLSSTPISGNDLGDNSRNNLLPSVLKRPRCQRGLSVTFFKAKPSLFEERLTDSNGSPDLLLSTLLTMWKEEGIRRRLWENVCRKANWQ